MRWKMRANIIIWTIVNLIAGCLSMCSPLYGGEPCSFLPAPPGKTPSCARPGLTYCEHPDHYPGQIITYLVQKWRYDHSTLLVSESRDEFTSYVYPPPSTVYGPPNYQSSDNIPHTEGFYPEPIHIPKPQFPFQDTSLSYIPPKFPSQNFTGYSDKNAIYQERPKGQHLNFKYTNSIPSNRNIYSQQHQPQSYFTALGQSHFAPYGNGLWKRRAEYERLKRSLRYKRSQRSTLRNFDAVYPLDNSTLRRSKRQNPTSETLCQVSSQYIVPRAALNNKGNWMYVVNMPEVDNRITQLVKSETCVSQTCSGICSLPQGYTSRCEQKYVQKRLVALEGGGNQLYTDVFWFPSCCVCTISNT